jgi:hypothetical protein
MTGTPEQFESPTLTFAEAEKGLGYPPGALRAAADEAGWTYLRVLTPESLCDVLCLIWPRMPDEQ